MKTLAIETSCDDTSLAIVTFDDGFFAVERMLAYTQTQEHQKRGGVVPEIAARSHADKILTILAELAIDWSSIEFISVTTHPGLPGALVVGVATAYTLGALHQKPVVEVNHIMGHVFSVVLERSLSEIQFPYLCLTVSGGHNDLYLVEENKQQPEHIHQNTQTAVGHTKVNHLAVGISLQVGPFLVTKLGQTIDDAAGECFDKVARMLGGPYPGGRWIDEIANNASPERRASVHYAFHAARLPDQPYNFSFSGIKGQIQQQLEQGHIVLSDEQEKACVASLFQEAVTDVLIEKVAKASVAFGAKTIGIVGGVSANLRLREKIMQSPRGSASLIFFPKQFVYCTDNAGMIGVVGLLQKV